jgi:hypothetical protein
MPGQGNNVPVQAHSGVFGNTRVLGPNKVNEFRAGVSRFENSNIPIQAGVRNVVRELGIDPAEVHVIGATDRYRTGTGYDITPVLAMVPPDLPLQPNPAEVAGWFEPPLGHVLDAANQTWHKAEWNGRAGQYIEILWQEHRIWGVTAGIIANLARRIRWHG